MLANTRSQIISDLLPLDAFQMGLAEVEKDDSTKNILLAFQWPINKWRQSWGIWIRDY